MNQSAATIKFCGQPLSNGDLELILELAGEFWGIARSELAATICELLEWHRPNGKLKTVECIQFLEALEAKGCLTLPRKRGVARGKDKPITRTTAAEEKGPILGTPGQMGGVVLERVVNKQQQEIFKEMVDRYHYLGYKTPFGARLRYLVKCAEAGRLLGCLQFSSPAWRVAARDRWIGWDTTNREAGLQRIVQNSRFLILPWVKVKGLASHILGRVNRRLADDWAELYGCRPLLVETFVEARFQGTCYRAANWLELGQTQGRGRMDRYEEYGQSKKTIWVYPLHRHARRLLVGPCT